MHKKGNRQKALGNSDKNAEVELLKNQLARALADYDNFRKRTEAREGELKFVITAKVVIKFLPVLDLLYEAQKHLNDSGIALTINAFEDVLKEEGVLEINPKEGESFNEELHEAIEVGKKEGLKDGQIIECVLRGWKFADGPIIRHAKVKVAKQS